MGLDVTYISEFGSAGWLADLSDLVDPSLTEECSQVRRSATIDGKLVAMPWFTNSSVLFYRTDVLEDLVQKLGYLGRLDGAGRQGKRCRCVNMELISRQHSPNLLYATGGICMGNGGDILDENGTLLQTPTIM